MERVFEVNMEVGGAIIRVVAEYVWYLSGPRLEAVMDADGEPLDLSRAERHRLVRYIRQKHNREGACEQL